MIRSLSGSREEHQSSHQLKVERYVLHQHLVNLGLAGPTAPILPFHALAVLPAELLAAPIPETSWAFEDSPIMSFKEWETYRRRSTSTVTLSINENDESLLHRLADHLQRWWLSGVRRFPSWSSSLAGLLHSWSQVPGGSCSSLRTPLRRLHSGRSTPVAIQGHHTGPCTDSSKQSAHSSSTELRAPPPNEWCAWLYSFRGMKMLGRQARLPQVSGPHRGPSRIPKSAHRGW